MKTRWETLLQPFQVEPELSHQQYLDLVKAYSSAGRYYHTLVHIQQVLDTVDQLRPFSLNFAAIQLATWFHDVIYDSQSQDNEEKSAEYAQVSLNFLNLPSPIIAQVKSLILSTKTHQALSTDRDSQILLDADLAILGSAEANYQAYAQAIRLEYAWVPEADYRKARKQVLEKFLQRESIYFTPQLSATLEAKARQNLQTEIVALSNLK